MKPFARRAAAGALAVALAGAADAQTPSPEAATAILPAVDGVLAAFDSHPVVALSDDHGLVEQEDFYIALVRDPRFAREVGGVVVEFGAASRQDVIDRYLAGEEVPYAELRTVWTEAVGWVPRTGYHLGYARFFAAVREVNAGLPPEQRIKVWLGEPPIDWSTADPSAFMAAMSARDSHAADVIVEHVLDEGGKALVIYGGLHLARGRFVRGLVEAEHPGAMFVVTNYSASQAPAACDGFLDEARALWPTPALATPATAGAPEPALTQCATWSGAAAGVRAFTLARGDGGAPVFAPPAGAAPSTGGASGAVVFSLSRRPADAEPGEALGGAGAAIPIPPPGAGAAFTPPVVEGDAVLFLGPLDSQSRGPGLPDYFLDDAYRAELDARADAGAPAAAPFPADLVLRKSDYEIDLDAPGYADLLDAMFAAYDEDGDGAVTAEEYARARQTP